MKDNKKSKEILLYIIFGLLTTLVSWTSYTFFVNFFSLSVTVSNILSWILSVIFAYITNKLWVFNSKSWELKLLLKEVSAFVSSRLITGVIEMVGVPILAKLGFDGIFYSLLERTDTNLQVLFTQGLYSKVAFAVVVVILNYVFSKLVVFKKHAGKQ